MNDKNLYGYNSTSGYGSYNGDYLSHEDQEIKTSQNLETIERLFDEWDDEDKTTSEAFSLNDQSFEKNPLPYINDENSDKSPTLSESSSFYNEPSDNTKYEDSIDPMDQTKEIDSVDLAELKALQEELHKLYDEPEPVQENPSQTQSKGKTLTKATKQGIAFSNGSLTKTFLECTVLCFVTASMGFAFLMNIISHI